MKKILALLLALAVIFPLCACGAEPVPEEILEEIQNRVVEKVGSYGLDNISVTAEWAEKGSKVQHYSLQCDHFSALSYIDMLRLNEALYSVETQRGDFYLDAIRSDGHEYRISKFDFWVHEDGRTVFDGREDPEVFSAIILGPLTEEVLPRTEPFGLENVTVSVEKNEKGTYSPQDYNYTLNCDRLRELSYEEMLELAKALLSVRIGVREYRLEAICSGGDEYTFDYIDGRVLKNGEVLYDSYEGSEAEEQDVQQLKERLLLLAERYGLKNLSVSSYREGAVYRYTVICDNFGQLSYADMEAFADEAYSVDTDNNIYFLGSIQSAGSEYQILPELRWIIRDEEIIYQPLEPISEAFSQGTETVTMTSGDYTDHLCEECGSNPAEIQVREADARYPEYAIEHYYCGEHAAAARSMYEIHVALIENQSRPGSSDKDSYGHDRSDAFVIAEKVVKNELKSPATAEFCPSSEAAISCSGDTWMVTGWVDAQNSFGATLRSTFTVIFTFSGNKEYTVIAFYIS